MILFLNYQTWVIQFFIATNSRFAIKKLYLIAQQNSISIPCLNILNDDYIISDFFEDAQVNKIMDTSVELYKEEIML